MYPSGGDGKIKYTLGACDPFLFVLRPCDQLNEQVRRVGFLGLVPRAYARDLSPVDDDRSQSRSLTEDGPQPFGNGSI